MSARALSLRSTIAIGFVTIVLLLSTLFSFLSFYDHNSVIRDYSNDLFNEQKSTIISALNAKFEKQAKLDYLAARAISSIYSEQGMLGVNDFMRLNVLQFTEIAAFYFTTVDNEFSGVINQSKLLSMTSNAETDFSIVFAEIAENGDLIKEQSRTPGFYATQRPWYKSALDKDTQGFSPIFKYHAYSTLALPHSLPVYASDGELIGVVGNNIFLNGLSGFLQEVAAQSDGIIVIIDAQKNLIASSLDALTPFQLEQKSSLESADEIENEFISVASTLSEPSSDNVPILDVAGEQYRTSTFLFDGVSQNEWQVSLFIPEQKFTKDVSDFAFRLTAIVAFILLISTFITWRVSQLISRPISDIIKRFSEGIEDTQSELISTNDGRYELSEVTALKHANTEYNKRISGYINDLQIQIEENRQQSSQIVKLAMVSESIEDLSVILSKEGIIDWANDKFYAFFELQGSDLKHRKLDQVSFVNEQHRVLFKKIYEVFEQKLTSEKPVNSIVSLGQKKHFELQAYAIENAESEGNVLVMISDISARFRYEEELTIWKEVFASANIGIAVSTQSENLVGLVNPAFAKMYGGTVSDYQIMEMASLFRDDGASEIDQALKQLHTYGEFSLETTHKRKNGETFPVLWTMASVENKEHQAIALVSSFIDLSENKKIQQELFQSQKMDSIGTLAGGIVHDMNNILGAIIGNAELGVIKNSNTVADELAESKNLDYFTSILNIARRGSKLTSQVLSFTRMETLTMAPVNVGNLLKDSMDLMLPNIPSNIELSLNNVLPPDAMIDGNMSQLEQVIVNLINNSVKAISKDPHAAGKIELHATIKNNKLIIEIEDNGCGISDDHLPYVFDPFYTTESRGKGTGLGLAIVSRIMKAHDAKINVSSVVGKYTRFTLVFEGVYTGSDNSKKQPEVDQNSEAEDNVLKVVLVDDDEELLTTHEELLTLKHMRVTSFKDPVLALDYCLNNHSEIDFLITDFDMPRMNGEQLVEALRNNGINTNVIMVTGFNELISKERLSKIGLHDIILKPIMIDDVVDKMHEMLFKEETS